MEEDDLLDRLSAGEFKNICFFTGAGISMGVGIPDFRSSGGFFEKYGESVFSKIAFKKSPCALFNCLADMEKMVLKENYSLPHQMMKAVCNKGWCRRVYTQNIDGLERSVGIPHELMVNVHGEWPLNVKEERVLKCIKCKHSKIIYNGPVLNAWKADMSTLPRCVICRKILQPDIVLYGDDISPDFKKRLEEDREVVDLLIVMGTSLQVYPAAILPSVIQKSAVKVWVNNDSPPEYGEKEDMMGMMPGSPVGVHWDVKVIGDVGEFSKKVLKKLSM